MQIPRSTATCWRRMAGSGGQCVLPDLPVSVPMRPNRLAELIPALERTTAEISRLLESVADDQDWRPNDGHWSFRHIAAHLEACQTECVLVRVRQIAAGAKPTFEFYDNDGWDFSDRDLRHSVREWRESRRSGVRVRAVAVVGAALTIQRAALGEQVFARSDADSTPTG